MTEEDKDRNWRQLEEAKESAQAEAEAWKDVALRGLVKDAGFDPNKGVTELALKEFQQNEDISPASLRPDDFKEFATNLGLSPEDVNNNEAGSEETNEDAKVVEKTTQNADELSQLGGDSDDETDHIAEANEKLLDGDVMGSINDKIGFLDENLS